MAFLEAFKNFAYSLVATAPSPATSGTTLVVTAADGAKFSAAPFWAVVWPAGANPLASNAEVVQVTAISTDTLTIVRAQDGSTARSIVVGDQIMLGITAGLLNQLGRFPATVAVWETDFTPSSPIWATSLGSGTSSGFSGNAGTTGHPGLVALNSGTTASAVASLVLAAASNTAPMDSGDNYEGELIFKTPAVVNDTDLRFGFTVQVSTVPTWGAWFEKLATDTNMFLKISNNGLADTRQDTGIAVVAATWYYATIRRIGNTFYYAFGLAAGTRTSETAYTATNNPAGGQSAYPISQIVVNGAAVSRTLLHDYMRASLVGLTR